MTNWKNIGIFAGVIFLLCFMVPIRIDDNRNVKLRTSFHSYVGRYNKSYRNDPVEYERRFNYFKISMQEADDLNHLSNGSHHNRATYGPTILSDMSKDEFREIHLADEKPLRNVERMSLKFRVDMNQKGDYYKYEVIRKRRASLPPKVDWRDKKVVGPIYNQGVCGACWAFSTIATIESILAIKTGIFTSLSVQEMIDCARAGNKGCLGGDICSLFEWLVLTKTPIVTESKYPLRLYESTCNLNGKTEDGLVINKYMCDDLSKSEDTILSMLAEQGPVSVAVNAISWQNYLGGVIKYNCGNDKSLMNHAVQLVGYDTTAEVPYYIARNSWGKEFGDKGYLKLAIGANTCGLANEVATVLL